MRGDGDLLPSYKLYKLDPVSGQRRPGEWLDAANDEEALARARQLAKAAKCELWLQSRLVGVLARET